MKLREMTNEELADLISDGCGTSMMGLAIREAAARLRLLDNVTTALNIEVGMNKVAAEMTASMRAKLKVAEEENAKLKARPRALVKELADMLDDNPCFDCDSCGEPCECCSDRENIRALVTKAREECK